MCERKSRRRRAAGQMGHRVRHTSPEPRGAAVHVRAVESVCMRTRVYACVCVCMSVYESDMRQGTAQVVFFASRAEGEKMRLSLSLFLSSLSSPRRRCGRLRHMCDQRPRCIL